MVQDNLFIIASATWLAFLHALAPDHWMPFVALAKASSWSRQRLVLVSFLAGTGHVLSSLVLAIMRLLLAMRTP